MSDTSEVHPRLLLVSNRLPISLVHQKGEDWARRPGSGSLATALEPVLREHGGIWIGWAGLMDADPAEVQAELDRLRDPAPYALRAVPLPPDVLRSFEQGAANEIFWPLFHGLVERCNYQHGYWRAYRDVNRAFARAVLEAVRPGDFIWVHDYHLITVAEELRALGFRDRLSFFLHIPFPCTDVFEQLPWAKETLRALLCYDTIGFQTTRDLRNFVQCVEAMAGEDVIVEADHVRLTRSGRAARVGAFPMSIDARLFFESPNDPDVQRQAEALAADFPHQRVMLGVDRLDYAKGIPQKLRGFERALERFPELRGWVTLLQLVVPSRERIPEYGRMKGEIEGLVGRINGRYTRDAWVPIRYWFGSWRREELLAYYRVARVALVTPLSDGMNLVSKEFVAASSDGEGVLVLSAFAGSVEELGEGALVVNPHDVEAVAEAIHRACTMAPQEPARRSALLKGRVRSRDVQRWVDEFLEAAGGTSLAAPGRSAAEAAAPIDREIVRPVPPSLKRPPRLRTSEPPLPRGGTGRSATT